LYPSQLALKELSRLNSRNDLNERINKTTTGDGVNLEFNVGDTTETSTTSPIKSTHSKPTDSRHAIQLETMNVSDQ
jgi:hypothetical protein